MPITVIIYYYYYDLKKIHHNGIFYKIHEKGTLSTLYGIINITVSPIFTLRCILATCTRDNHHHLHHIMVEHSQIGNGTNLQCAISQHTLFYYKCLQLRLVAKETDQRFELPMCNLLAHHLLRDWRIRIRVTNVQSLSIPSPKRLEVQDSNHQCAISQHTIS